MNAHTRTHEQPTGTSYSSWMRIALCWLGMLAAGLTVSADESNQLQGSSLEIGGSVALADLIAGWIGEFRRIHPEVEITLFDGGSEAGMDALINGTEDIALVSLPLSSSQRSAFGNHFGYPPTVIPVAMDGVAIYVNPANPLNRISLVQLDGIFSSTYRCAGSEPIQTWEQLGVQGSLRKRSIEAYGLSSSTGVYRLFQRVALCKGDFKPEFQAVPGPAALESAVASEPQALGFSSSALTSPGIRPVALAPDDDARALLPTRENIRQCTYPLSRTLAIAVNRVPGSALPRALTVFIDYLKSGPGQSATEKWGFVPVASACSRHP